MCYAGKEIAHKVGLSTCPGKDVGRSEAKSVGVGNLPIGGCGHARKGSNSP